MPPKKRELYCICRTSKTNTFMIACDGCDMWYHGDCIGIDEKQGNAMPVYFCVKCQEQYVRCANPECRNPAIHKRTNEKGQLVPSKYCSHACGIAFNRKRYEKIFLPKWKELKENPSSTRTIKVEESKAGEKEAEELEFKIGQLRREREDLEKMINTIKSEATKLKLESDLAKEKSNEQDLEDDDDNSDEAIAFDQTKTFCVICGIEQPAEKAFKHWVLCHKRQESQYNFTSAELVNKTLACPEDPDPKIYCEKEDKKTKRFCMHLGSACPQHSNWQGTKDEVCGCPTNVMQDLVADGKYCLELKRDCNQHYNWDRFRLAMKDMERSQSLTKLINLKQRLRADAKILNDTYGGVIGIMLHSTKSFRPKLSDEESPDVDMIDVNH